MTYDSAGNVATITGPPDSNSPGAPNTFVSYTYDADGNTLSETDGTGAGATTMTYCYDANGNQTAVVAPDGNVNGVAPCNTNPAYPNTVDPNAYPMQAAFETTYSYDTNGNQVSTTGPATIAAPHGTTSTFTYDTLGNQLTSTDPNGITATTLRATRRR